MLLLLETLLMVGVCLVSSHTPKLSFRRRFPVKAQCIAYERELLEKVAPATSAISSRLVTLLLWKYNERACSTVEHTAQYGS